MDRWLKTGRLETRHDNRYDSTESCSEVPFHQTKNKGNDDRKGKKRKYDSDYLQLGLKDKYRNRLNAEPDLRLKLSDIEPNFELLCSIKQQQISQ